MGVVIHDRSAEADALYADLTAARLELHRLRELLAQSDLHHIRLRAGLREALAGWSNRAEGREMDERAIFELEKLLGGEP